MIFANETNASLHITVDGRSLVVAPHTIEQLIEVRELVVHEVFLPKDVPRPPEEMAAQEEEEYAD